MSLRTFFILSCLPLVSALSCRAEHPVVRIAFYNAESLYDTLAGSRADEREWTPEGRKKWDTPRYRRKIENIARVIDDLNADLIAVSEIENENVVRDLMYAMRTDYNYLHRDSRDRRGMDIVLFYRGSRFYPERTELRKGTGLPRELLIVEGSLEGIPVTLIVCHLPSLLNRASDRRAALRSLRAAADSLRDGHPLRNLIVLGDFNAAPDSPDFARILSVRSFLPQDGSRPVENEKNELRSPFIPLGRKGYGSYVYRDKRFLYDHILLSPSLTYDGAALRYGGSCGIFVRDYMIHREGAFKGYPIRTFRQQVYTGGYSDHFPVFLDLEKQESE